MKILFVNDYSEKVGGTEIYLHSLGTYLSMMGHDVEYFFGNTNYSKARTDQTTFSSFLNRIFSFRQYFRFKTLLEEFRPDIIHVHNIFNEVTPSIFVCVKDTPILMTLHDYQVVQAVFNPEKRTGKPCKRQICPGCLNCVGIKGMFFERIKRFLHSLLLQKVAVFIAPSNYMQGVIRDNSSILPIQMYNGFNLSESSTPRTRFAALYVGRLTEDKGIQNLIEIVPSIVLQFPDFILTVAGTGDLEAKLQKRASELNLGESVRFVGQTDESKTRRLYEECTFLILPSIWPENLPTVCIEALSAGRPVLASEVGGIPEIVRENENGLLIKPADKVQLREKLVQLLGDNELYKKLQSKSHESVQIFKIENHANKLLSLYSSLLIR